MTMSNMNFRVLVRDLVISKLCNAWARSFVVNSMTKRCRRDRTVRDVWHRFRQAVLRPKHALLFTTVSAAYKNNEEKPGMPTHCSKDISDAEMQALIADIESMEELAKATLFCIGCAKRVVIDSRHSGVRYCNCENAQPPVRSYDGWEPYMEAEDVIIWRKEYKPGGLYAYKVYGRYKHIKAEDFAAIQVDGAYRKVWDSAVASLSVVERTANGMAGQDVLHWEVLWPRLFANRDYVYIRRHKEYALKDSCMAHKEAIFEDESCGPITGAVPVPVAAENPCEYQCERECVHSPAKRKSQEAERKFLEAERKYQEAERKSQEAERKYQEAERKTQEAERKFLEAERKSQEVVGKLDPAQRQRSQAQAKASEEPKRPNQPNEHENRVYVIVSRSCKHPQVPSMGSAIRVSEYWSHMVIKTLDGPNKNGMEFVLTYYDEPAVGGLPTAVMSWAMGRAGPAFLDRMRKAAMEYQAWKKKAQDEVSSTITTWPFYGKSE
ncbi:uncharacterized protein LOC113229184 [Hyposmocoma kahamanoa]|uniref:uncharacterized protein LOC113229184 n=1 Tax=Hyposmocoma kahamanoa TaxID=1477025 RepID=UPI000E6DA07B|nr:uncharacterized protein LOC113229184 [Hyposmocoma kahamanoa]